MTQRKAKQLSKAEGLALLELCQEEAAMLMATTFETQAALQKVIGIVREIHEGITGEEAPEYQPEFRMRRRAG